jgi:hypothetical protein
MQVKRLVLCATSICDMKDCNHYAGGARRKVEGFDWRTLKGNDQPTESFVDQSTYIFNKPVVMIRLIVLAM